MWSRRQEAAVDQERPPIGLRAIFNDPKRVSQGFQILKALTFNARAKATLWSDYRPWRKVRSIARDLGYDAIETWIATKLRRQASMRTLPLLLPDGKDLFHICHDALIDSALHRIDRATGGGGPAALEGTRGALGDEDRRRALRIRTLMDEAAESSIIEGAATTRKLAVEMLRAGRSPKSKAERMVHNNYRAMQAIKDWRARPLSVDMLVELQSLLTEGTNPKEERGRLRRMGEDIRVWDDRDDAPIYTPPAADMLPARLDQLCVFANTQHDGAEFLHPIVKAAILHFMIGFEHPFVDGNGRTARAVFYWYAIKHDYTIVEYLAISEIIRKGIARYPQAYLDSELDDGDLTYFVLYHLDVIEQALDGLAKHIEREEEKLKRSEEIVRVAPGINLRQRWILEHAIRHPAQEYTVKSHANSVGIAPATARADLEGLVSEGLMGTMKRRKEVIYVFLPKLAEKLSRKAKGRA